MAQESKTRLVFSFPMGDVKTNDHKLFGFESIIMWSLNASGVFLFPLSGSCDYIRPMDYLVFSNYLKILTLITVTKSFLLCNVMYL